MKKFIDFKHHSKSKEKSITMILKCLLLFFICQPTNSDAQKIEQYVFASQGNYDESESMSLSWTIGDSFIESTDLGEHLFTQGFQQPFLKLRKIETAEISSFETKIYPNPTRGILNIQIEESDPNYSIEVYDVTGRLIHKTQSQESLVTLDLTEYHAGQYFIRLTNQDQSKLSIFEIIRL